MFPPEILLACLAAVLVVVVAPGPDNLLAISRGLGQGRTAAALSATGASLGYQPVLETQGFTDGIVKSTMHKRLGRDAMAV